MVVMKQGGAELIQRAVFADKERLRRRQFAEALATLATLETLAGLAHDLGDVDDRPGSRHDSPRILGQVVRG